VLRDASLRIAAGESVAIVGPSGSGKSTILNLIGALDRPDGGRIQVGDRDLSSLDDLALARFRNRTVGFVFQAHHLLSHCTVWENVLVPALAEASSVDAATEERARRLLKRVGLEDRMGHRPGQLSGGERQRAAVVRALINEPGLLLADEPTGALDRASASELARLLLELNREQHLTLVLVTHAPDLARQMGRVLELRDGRLHPAG
jgi:lipoprotein-releasing system ATP-binding protein